MITLVSDDGAVGKELETALLESLRKDLTQGFNSSICLETRSPSNELVGGLTGSTSYGWLHIKVLWVAEPLRGQGLGSQFLEHAEALARERGCHSAWLETSNPAALKFYLNLGFREFGRLSNGTGQSPASHRRWFLKKALAPTQ